MRSPRHFAAALILGAVPAHAADGTVPRGWFTSGWPAALADAACDDDMACIARLQRCGPEDGGCGDGVAYCSLTRAGTPVYETACQTRRQGDSVTAHVPSRDVVHLRFGAAPRLNGAPAEIVEDACLFSPATRDTFCARPITQPHTLRAWAED